MLTPNQKLVGTVVILVNALLAVLYGVANIGWSDLKKGAVALLVNAAAAFAVALITHFQSGTKKQPVALLGTFDALAVAIFGLGVAFHWWLLTPSQNTLLINFINAIILLVGSTLVHNAVGANLTPPAVTPDGVEVPIQQ